MSKTANALAADLEDILLRFHGDPDDAETMRRVIEDLLAEKNQDAAKRMKHAANSADVLVRRFAEKGQDDHAQYYAGMRDAYLRSAEMRASE